MLWEVTLSGSGGFPVTIRGPREDETVSCFAEDDIRAEFFRAASHGLVGRKIAALWRHSISVAEARAAADADGDAGAEEAAASGANDED